MKHTEGRMVFPTSLTTRINTMLAIAVAALLATACSSRSGKQVEVQCRPGQTKGADGKCQAAAAPSNPSPVSPGSTIPGDDDGSKLPIDTGEEKPPVDTEPGETETPGTSNKPPVDTGTPGGGTQGGGTQGGGTQGGGTQGGGTQGGGTQGGGTQGGGTQGGGTQGGGTQGGGTQGDQKDPMNASEAVTNLFADSPKKVEDGAPHLALKLVSSPKYGKVARVAFSYTTDVKNAAYIYHKKEITAKGSAIETRKTLQVEFSTIPVSVTFEWNGKKCETGMIDVGFTEKKATATCN